MKEQKTKVDRITLKSEEALKLDRWIEQMTLICPGISISRAGLVSWLVCLQPEILKPADRRQLKERFSNELKRAEWLVREIKGANERGEKPSIEDLLAAAKPAAADASNKDSSKTQDEE